MAVKKRQASFSGEAASLFLETMIKTSTSSNARGCFRSSEREGVQSLARFLV
jgi:hypothetical protein